MQDIFQRYLAQTEPIVEIKKRHPQYLLNNNQLYRMLRNRIYIGEIEYDGKVYPGLHSRRGKDLMGTFLSDIVLQVLSFVAENERTTIRQRQAEGIAAAKAKGVKFGRPPLPLPENFYEVHKSWRAKKITLKEAAKACDMPIGTFYGKARKFENVT